MAEVATTVNKDTPSAGGVVASTRVPRPLARSIESIITMFLILVGTGFDELWKADAAILHGSNRLQVNLGAGTIEFNKSRLLFFVLMTVLLRFALGSRNHLTVEYGEGGERVKARRVLLDLAFLMGFGLLLRATASQGSLREFFWWLASTFAMSAAWSGWTGRWVLWCGWICSRANWTFWIPMDVLAAAGCCVAALRMDVATPWPFWILIAVAACVLAAWDVHAQLRAVDEASDVPRHVPSRLGALFGCSTIARSQTR